MDQALSDAGKVSVPISSILDALKDTLSAEKRAALFTQLIGLRPAGVAPGDLITAELFNQVLSDLNGLAIRVAALEGVAGGPVIERIDPATTDKPAASLITIVGRNFFPDDVDTFVSFGTVKISDFAVESDSTHLILPIPVSLDGLPADFPVTVTCRGKKSNSVKIHVVPKVVIPGGTVFVKYQGAPLPPIKVGDTYNLVWRVVSQLNVPQTFTLAPLVTSVVGSSHSAWLAAIKLAPATDVTLEPGEFVDVTMTVKVPSGATSANINLRAESTTSSFEGQSSSALAFVVGQKPPVSDIRAEIDMAAFVGNNDLKLRTVQVEGKTVAAYGIAPSKTVNLPMQVSTSADGGGFYRFEAKVEPAPGQTGRFTPGPIAMAQQIAGASGQPFFVPITSSSLADTTAVSFVVVTAKCFANQNAASPEFTSFERFPIAGKT
ncbi:MAG TPA: IPT/TIG domain-containing protein [Allosphingosinicella sp.]|jgi:hypothetical protein